MKIILENFNYRGMHFDKYVADEVDLSGVGDLHEKNLGIMITEMIKEDLDRRFWKEVNSRT